MTFNKKYDIIFIELNEKRKNMVNELQSPYINDQIKWAKSKYEYYKTFTKDYVENWSIASQKDKDNLEKCVSYLDLYLKLKKYKELRKAKI